MKAQIEFKKVDELNVMEGVGCLTVVFEGKQEMLTNIKPALDTDHIRMVSQSGKSIILFPENNKEKREICQALFTQLGHSFTEETSAQLTEMMQLAAPL